MTVSTEPIDRARCEHLALETYENFGFERPVVIFAESPFAAFRDHIHKASDGVRLTQFDSQWLQAIDRHIGKDVGPMVKPFIDLGLAAGGVIPLEAMCVIVERPCEIHLTEKDGLPHNLSGAAVRYLDGWALYAFNGVAVSEEVATLKPEEIDVEKHILNERNVDVRREVLRKVGVENMFRKLRDRCTLLDKSDSYELWDLMPVLSVAPQRSIAPNPNPGRAPYLLMKNPSVEGAWHLEGVGPRCENIKGALAWRNGLEVYAAPKMLT